jgi:hypothetical protein
MTALGSNPLHCMRCNLEVAPEGIPLPVHLVDPERALHVSVGDQLGMEDPLQRGDLLGEPPKPRCRVLWARAAPAMTACCGSACPSCSPGPDGTLGRCTIETCPRRRSSRSYRSTPITERRSTRLTRTDTPVEYRPKPLLLGPRVARTGDCTGTPRPRGPSRLYPLGTEPSRTRRNQR